MPHSVLGVRNKEFRLCHVTTARRPLIHHMKQFVALLAISFLKGLDTQPLHENPI